MNERDCQACGGKPKAAQFYGAAEFARALDGLQLAEVNHSSGCDIPRHAHEGAFVSVLLSGKYQSRFGKTAVEFEAGRAVWHESGFDHEDSIAAGGARFFCVEIDERLLSQLRLDHPEGLASRSLDCQASAALLGLFVANRRGDDALCLEAGGAEFLGALCGVPASRDGSRAPWLNRVHDRLCSTPEARASLADLAAIAAVHPSHLARSFRASFGCSIGEYARSVRLTRAWGMLVERKMAVAEVAYSLGYADQSHFTREFSRHVRLPPAALRRSLAA